MFEPVLVAALKSFWASTYSRSNLGHDFKSELLSIQDSSKIRLAVIKVLYNDRY